jgi:hypothetical protein
MFLAWVRRMGWVGGLSLLTSLAGCGKESDDGTDDTEVVDPSVGEQDSGQGSAVDASGDAGGNESDSSTTSMDSGGTTGPMELSCGSLKCTGATIASTEVRACCTDATDAGPAGCGLIADDIKKANPSSRFTGCVPKDVPQASASSYCGEFWDEVETNGRDNGGLDIMSSGIQFVYEGCCLASGECGAYLRSPRDVPAIDTHLGCVSFGRLREALSAGSDGGTAPSPKNPPFCNPSNGEAASSGTVPGVPKFMCGCGKDKQPEAGVFPPCVANLAAEVCGRDDPSAMTLSAIPEYICGCTESSKLPCMKNVAAAVCGTKAVDASSADLSKLPEYICGCGPTTVDPGGALPCLSNVETSTCGKLQVSDEKGVERVPEFLCGCGDGVRYTNQAFPCLSNVDDDLCGGADVTEANDPSLARVPQFLCGCGNDLSYDNNPQSFRCLSNVATNLCGRLDIPGGHPSLAAMPAYLCGCGNGELYDDESFRCLSNVASSVCGAVAITSANSPLLSGLPVYLCGCGSDNPFAAICLRNVDSRWCGARDVPVDGRGTEPVADNCLMGIPEYLRGCGPGTRPTADNRTCLRNVLNYPGCDNTETDNRGTESTSDDCLRGVPEYAIGCGEAVLTPDENGCLPGAPQLRGCVDVKITPAQVPEYLCGCGNGQSSQPPPAYPCLTNVAVEICGGAPVTASAQVRNVLNNVCGCGDGVMNQTGCVKNVPSTVCGAVPACVQDICEGGAGGRPAECRSSNNDGIVDYCALTNP